MTPHEITGGDASPEEAAAIIAALERFAQDARAARAAAAGADSVAAPAVGPWKREALVEGVARQPGTAPPWEWPQPSGRKYI